MNELEYENILNEKERELEELRESAELTKEFKADEVDNVRRLMGHNWNDELANLPVEALRQLAKNLSNNRK